MMYVMQSVPDYYRVVWLENNEIAFFFFFLILRLAHIMLTLNAC